MIQYLCNVLQMELEKVWFSDAYLSRKLKTIMDIAVQVSDTTKMK